MSLSLSRSIYLRDNCWKRIAPRSASFTALSIDWSSFELSMSSLNLVESFTSSHRFLRALWVLTPRWAAVNPGSGTLIPEALRRWVAKALKGHADWLRMIEVPPLIASLSPDSKGEMPVCRHLLQLVAGVNGILHAAAVFDERVAIPPLQVSDEGAQACLLFVNHFRPTDFYVWRAMEHSFENHSGKGVLPIR